MKITRIRPHWGLQIEDTSIDEILDLGRDYWKFTGYENDLILFKGLGKIKDVDYFQLCSYFGKPWSKNEYTYSKEVVKDVETDKHLTRFSNILSPSLGTSKMRWHADIPLRDEKSFPWRALYIVSNPSPETGLTSWLNIKLDIINPTAEELELYNNMSLTMQSWHRAGEETQEKPFIKIDPVTGRKSLRLNCYSTPEIPNMWIKHTKINTVDVDNKETLQPILDNLEARGELIYTHQWDLHDLIIYNNWSFVHKRTEIILNNEGDSREFLRVNMDHIV